MLSFTLRDELVIIYVLLGHNTFIYVLNQTELEIFHANTKAQSAKLAASAT